MTTCERCGAKAGRHWCPGCGAYVPPKPTSLLTDVALGLCVLAMVILAALAYVYFSRP